MSSNLLTAVSQVTSNWITAGAMILISVVLAYLFDRLVFHRAGQAAGRLGRGGVSRATQTRISVVRRLIFVVFIVIGCALALAQFPEASKLATAIFASSAVIGLVIGMAARQTLSNPVAGLWLAMTQPVRIGDQVSFDDVTGRISELTLSYTYIDPGDGTTVVVPNESLVSGTLCNHSTGDRAAPITADVWVPAAADLEAVEATLKREAGADAVKVKEWTTDGLRIQVSVEVGQARTRAGGEESALLEKSQKALHAAGLLS